MDGTECEVYESLKRCFAGLDDPRVVGRCDHRLLDVVVITLLAVLCGAEDWPDIELFGKTRKEWLSTFLPLPNGIPSHDTFCRVLGALDRSQFAQALFQWTQALHAAKGNQSGLQEDVQRLYEQAIDTDFAGLEHEVHQTTETGHGRTEERTCQVIGIPKDHPQRGKWKDLSTLAAVTSRRIVGDKETWETRLYVSSHSPRAKLLAQSIRRHWAIENSQHWVLDVTFGEDSRRQQDRNGAANLAAVRRPAISLLRRETTNKRGAKNKRLHCALDSSYLLRVLHTAKF